MGKKSLYHIGPAVAFLLLSYSVLVSANPIGPDCSTCQGGIYTLSRGGNPISTTATTETWRISLQIDTSGVNIPGVKAVDTVAIKVSSKNAFIGASLFSSPAGSWNYFGNQTAKASGCTGTGGGGFTCAHTSTPHQAAVGGLLAWVWDVTVKQGKLGDTSPTIKARYVDADGNKVGDLVSEDSELQVPEPGTLAMVGLGLLGIGLRGCKKRT
jgi:hypothetical protein